MRRILIGATAVFLPLLLAACGSAHRSDDEMIRSFKKDKATYTELVRMFQVDRGLRQVGRLGGTWPDKPSVTGVDDKRIARYYDLLDEVGALSLERHGKDNVLFIKSEGGFTTTTRKGYAFAKEPRSPVVEDTSRYQGNAREVYHRIEDGWYVVYVR